MDVSQQWARVAFFVSILTLTACSKSNDEKFRGPQSQCAGAVIKDSFLVNWKDGRTTSVTYKNKEEFLNSFVDKHYDEIEFAEYNQKISLGANQLPSDKLSHEEFEPLEEEGIDLNWGAKISNANFAWQEEEKGSDITVAVIDTGIDTTHIQLQNQLAYNPGETGLDSNGFNKRNNGIDDDGNGYIDDYVGYDFIQGHGFVEDNNGHGTHVSGIVAAEHNQNDYSDKVMQGVAPHAKILPLDFLDFKGNGNLDHAIQAIDYAVAQGAKIINASWGGSVCASSLALKIKSLEDHGVLFISAAGNNSKDIDRYPEYPAAFNMSHQVTVGSIASSGLMGSHSNYGFRNVHLFAPGQDIYSLLSGSFDKVILQTGTSMATPYVAGAAAILWSARPQATALQIKASLLESVSNPSGGRYFNSTNGALDIKKALKNIRLKVP